MSRLSKSVRSTTARKTRLGFECLEGRDQPSVSFLNEIMTVTGTTGNDTIEIRSPQANQTVVLVNGVQQFSGSVTIQHIIVDGLAGNDNLLVKGLQSGITSGTDVSNVESATVGEQNPVTGLSSTANVRSNFFIRNPNFLLLNNSAATTGAGIVVSATAATGIAPGRMGFEFNSPTASLIVQSGSGNDTFNLNSSQVGTTFLNGTGGTDTINVNGSTGAVQVNGGAGADNINIVPTTHTLESIGGRVNISDGLSQDKVSIGDQEAGAGSDGLTAYSATLSAGQLTRTETRRFNIGFFPIFRTETDTIAFDRVGTVNFAGPTRAQSGSSIALQGSNATTTTTIDPGTVSLVKLGSSGNTLDPIDGPVTVTGGTAGAKLQFNDVGQFFFGQRYTVTGTTVSRGGMGLVSMGNFLGQVEIDGGARADTFNVTAPLSGGRNLTVDGNGGADILIAPAGDNQWTILGQNLGLLNGSTSFVDVDSLDGSAGADTFRFANGAGVSGRIDGAGGFDTLDYRDFTTPVNVNLGLGTATRVSGGISRILNVFGGSASDILTGSLGNNVLLGNGGIDQLNGGAGGRDLLVGGTGGDSLTTAGTGDTIYIGGDLAAADRNNVNSVKGIMAEWTSANAYATRVANLQNGAGATGGVRLNAAVLDSDFATDAYNPKAGQDVFFVDGFDSFNAGHLPAANEQVISV